MIKQAVEGDSDDKLFMIWNAHIENKSFADFKEEWLRPEKSKDEILANVESILDNNTFTLDNI